MTPGLTRGPPFPPGATRGAIVAIASLEKPSVPMVVGVCEIDVVSLHEVRGAKGHAVRGEHWYGDEIWAWSAGGGAGGQAPIELPQWDSQDDVDGLVEKLNHAAVEDSDDEPGQGGVSVVSNPTTALKEGQQNDFVEGEDGTLYEKVELEQKEFTTKGQ